MWTLGGSGPSGGRVVAAPPRSDVMRIGDVEARLKARGEAFSWVGEPPSEFAGVAVDSRKVSPGDLFCAIRGLRADGHEYVKAAAAAGAVAAVVERTLPVPLPQLVVTDTRMAAAQLAALCWGDPGAALQVVGVTGTNGKTTTALLLRHLLGTLGPAAALGTLGVVHADGDRHAGGLTTPDQVGLMGALSELGDRGAAYVAMEVSSHALEQRRVDALSFDAAVFTNLTRDHLDYHGDMAAYRDAKVRLADLLKAGAPVVVNSDEPAWTDADFGAHPKVTYGVGSGAAVRAETIRLSLRGSRWTLVGPSGRARVRLPLLGAFNVHNALGAVAASLELGASLESVVKRLASVPQVPGRMEVLARRPSLVLRDYAHTPDALERALAALRPLKRGRLIAVFGCGGDRDRGKRPLMGRIAVAGADLAIVTSDNPRTEDPEQIIAEIVAGLERDTYLAIVDRRDAIGHALSIARRGDVVLLAGKGHETQQEISGRMHPFDETEIVADILRARST